MDRPEAVALVARPSLSQALERLGRDPSDPVAGRVLAESLITAGRATRRAYATGPDEAQAVVVRLLRSMAAEAGLLRDGSERAARAFLRKAIVHAGADAGRRRAAARRLEERLAADADPAAWETPESLLIAREEQATNARRLRRLRRLVGRAEREALRHASPRAQAPLRRAFAELRALAFQGRDLSSLLAARGELEPDVDAARERCARAAAHQRHCRARRHLLAATERLRAARRLSAADTEALEKLIAAMDRRRRAEGDIRSTR